LFILIYFSEIISKYNKKLSTSLSVFWQKKQNITQKSITNFTKSIEIFKIGSTST